MNVIANRRAGRFMVLISGVVVAAMWVGFLFGWGGRHANVVSQRYFDKALLILPFISISMIALGFCIQYRKWVAFSIVMGLDVSLLLVLVVTISIWSVTVIDNRTDYPLTAVSIDFSHDIVRVVKLPPKKERAVTIMEGESLSSMADDKYLIVVYDSSGNIYHNETVRTGDGERVHVISITEGPGE